MIDNNILTPKERLMIAAMILPKTLQFCTNDEEVALGFADRLIKESGCIVAGAVSLEHNMD